MVDDDIILEIVMDMILISTKVVFCQSNILH